MKDNSILDTLIEIALKEDLGDAGDITSNFFIDNNSLSNGTIIAKENCVIAGSEIAERVFKRLDPNIEVKVELTSGSIASTGDVIISLSGKSCSILSAERIALNFLQRLSGIATITKKYVEAVKETNAKILDTRKTTPGWRVLEKMAVKSGGGLNHRMGLFDMAMLKDNHLTNESDPRSLQQKINAFKKQYPAIRLEVEADTLEQVNEFIKMEGVDVILLDNMALTEISEAVSLRRGEIKFEASGGINLDTVIQYAETGVDLISVGALTHSAVSVDLSLELET
ncbi:MAG: nicotinate-nucleotide diphosphorylase (carboxylating) [Verrucomicrobiales bacterium]|nr:nicotinate-nucleotide diphosphorylase (carboxylating) [Verrucomicrobiales bacterium]|tara:strand:- start:270 stop:1118 length:849 start_codon:yes stop_codon:yes gene_type:complete